MFVRVCFGGHPVPQRCAPQVRTAPAAAGDKPLQATANTPPHPPAARQHHHHHHQSASSTASTIPAPPSRHTLPTPLAHILPPPPAHTPLPLRARAPVRKVMAVPFLPARPVRPILEEGDCGLRGGVGCVVWVSEGWGVRVWGGGLRVQGAHLCVRLCAVRHAKGFRLQGSGFRFKAYKCFSKPRTCVCTTLCCWACRS